MINKITPEKQIAYLRKIIRNNNGIMKELRFCNAYYKQEIGYIKRFIKNNQKTKEVKK